MCMDMEWKEKSECKKLTNSNKASSRQALALHKQRKRYAQHHLYCTSLIVHQARMSSDALPGGASLPRPPAHPRNIHI